ncbi:MAG: 50S ribosomal protein L9, partial [Proteobacteria bacterium]|nr:50S ribosomal protein L9 [Pseudomonadota bacterium]
MKVILSHDVPALGRIGEIVNVKNGYARNYLLPRGLANVANEANEAQLKHFSRQLEKKKLALLAEAKSLAAKIEKISVTVSKQVGPDERIFGTVTHAELETLLNQEGVKVSKRDISISEEIKKIG